MTNGWGRVRWLLQSPYAPSGSATALILQFPALQKCEVFISMDCRVELAGRGAQQISGLNPMLYVQAQINEENCFNIPGQVCVLSVIGKEPTVWFGLVQPEVWNISPRAMETSLQFAHTTSLVESTTKPQANFWVIAKQSAFLNHDNTIIFSSYFYVVFYSFFFPFLSGLVLTPPTSIDMTVLILFLWWF